MPSSKEVFEHVAVVMYRSGTAGTLNNAVFLVELEFLRTVVLGRSGTSSHRVGSFFAQALLSYNLLTKAPRARKHLNMWADVSRLRCFLAGLFIVV